MPEIRLQKYLAQCGIASRRKCEAYISDGKVKVNGQVVTQLGTKIDPAVDTVQFNGQRCRQSDTLTIMLNKPKDYLVTRYDPKRRRTIYDLLPAEYRKLHPIGRIDRNTTGLILLTNDGNLTQRLMHPHSKRPKFYRVHIDRVLREDHADELERGVFLDGRKTLPCRLAYADTTGTVIDLQLREGRNRQIRRMFEALGYEVLKLKRTGIGKLGLGRLKSGEYRTLTDRDLKGLLS